MYSVLTLFVPISSFDEWNSLIIFKMSLAASDGRGVLVPTFLYLFVLPSLPHVSVNVRTNARTLIGQNKFIIFDKAHALRHRSALFIVVVWWCVLQMWVKSIG